MSNSLVSVIVPVYKVEKYLNACVESVLRQTYKELELILVDDGSPDRCGEICDQYASIDARIRVIHQKNSGPSAARNAGLDIATGAYIAFLDSDDMLPPQAIEILLNELVNNHLDMVSGYYEEMDATVQSPATDQESNTIFQIIQTEQIKRHFFDYFPHLIPVSVWGKMFKREIIAHTRFNTRATFAEDYEFLLTILDSCTFVGYTTASLHYYRQTANSLIHAPFSVRNFDILIVDKTTIIPFIEKYATRENVNKAYDSYIDNYVYMHFMKYHNRLKGKPLDLSFALLYKRLVLCRWRKYMCSGGRRAIVSLLSLISIRWAYWFAKRYCKTMFAYLH